VFSIFPAYLDSKTGRQAWISVDQSGIPPGLWRAWKTMVDSWRWAMPVEGSGPARSPPSFPARPVLAFPGPRPFLAAFVHGDPLPLP